MTGRRGAQLPDAQPAATVFSVRVLRLLELRPHAETALLWFTLLVQRVCYRRRVCRV